ncbi:Uncharacterised protein [uncultured archaeon]|nr:Uncharacterised protein [uncultured archaeon]
MVSLVSAGIGIVQLVIAIILAVIALYIGFSVFGKITKMDEQKELAKGNVAVGVLIASIFIAIGIVVQSGIAGLSSGLSKAMAGDFIALAASVLQLILGIVFAIVAIYIALKVIDKLTPKIPLFEELGKGNVAAALAMAGVTITTAIIIQSGILGITSALA